MIAIPNHRTNIARNAKQERLVREAKRLIEQSFTAHFSLTNLASVLETSPRALRESFQKGCGCSPWEYQTQLRIKEAQRLLHLGQPIKQIVIDVGFFDQSHLTRHFKRLTGTTPARYGLVNLKTPVSPAKVNQLK